MMKEVVVAGIFGDPPPFNIKKLQAIYRKLYSLRVSNLFKLEINEVESVRFYEEYEHYYLNIFFKGRALDDTTQRVRKEDITLETYLKINKDFIYGKLTMNIVFPNTGEIRQRTYYIKDIFDE